MKTLNVNEGLTNNYLVPAVFGCLISIFFAVLIPVIGIPLLILSTCWFAATNGVEITADGTKYRRYAGYLGMRIGRWKPLESPTKAILVISSESSSILGYIGGGSFPAFGVGGSFYGQYGKSKSLTYDVLIYTKEQQPILLYDFLRYKDAKTALYALEKNYALEIHDRVAEKLVENRNRRRR